MSLLTPGAEVADFTLPDQRGAPARLTDLLRSGPVVLFFYPAAMSPGCTVEGCHFRDLTADFAAAGAAVVGVSGDDVAAQRRFADRNRLTYPLLADTEHAVSDAFGVTRRLGPPRRATFVVGEDRRVRCVVHAELNMHQHADRALAFLREGQLS